jgi:hypothetical protein
MRWGVAARYAAARPEKKKIEATNMSRQLDPASASQAVLCWQLK